MLFNSYIFIFLFLPVSLTGYYILNHIQFYRTAGIFLIGMSLWFYGYFNLSYLPIICASIIVNFGISKIMECFETKQKTKKIVLALGIFVNIASIFYFKYFDFFIENVNIVFHKSFELKNIILPLGISFFTFQQISYLVDSYKGETKEYTFIEYALFVSFFPQLIAGPIVLHNEMIPQFRNQEKRHFISPNFAKGLYIFSLGLFKKVIIADSFGAAVNYGFEAIELLSSMEAIIVSLSYTFQLYFDFSGYCDMAVGIGSMFNIELPQNFNSPYKSASITEFWERWHMSLTRFLKAYIYIPLGGNRKGKVRTYINIMIVYLLSGIWHGANWTFILWGGLHGFLSCLNRAFEKIWKKLGKVTNWCITFSVLNILWILFRADDIASAGLFMQKLFSLSGWTIREELLKCFELGELAWIELRIPLLKNLFTHIAGLNMWMFILGAFYIVLNCCNSREIEFKPTMARSLLTVMFLVWSVVSFKGVSTFLYFNF